MFILSLVPCRCAAFQLRTNISVVCCFFYFLIVCLYIPFNKVLGIVSFIGLFLIWVFQLKALLIVIPMYLAFSVDFSLVL